MSLRASASSRIRARDSLLKDNKNRDGLNNSQTILDRLNASTVQRKNDHVGLLPAGFCPTPTGSNPSKEVPHLQKSRSLKMRQLLSTSPEGSPDSTAGRHSSPRKVFNLSLSNARRQADEAASKRMLQSTTEGPRLASLGDKAVILSGLAARLDTVRRQETISEFWQPDVSVTSTSAATARSEFLQHVVPAVDESCVRTDHWVHEQAAEKPGQKHSSSLPEGPMYDGQRSDTLKQMRKSWNLNPGPATPSRWSVRQSIDPVPSPGGSGDRASELQTALDALGDLRQPLRSWTAGLGGINIVQHGASEEKPESYSPIQSRASQSMPDLTRWMQDQDDDVEKLVATTERRHFTTEV